MKHINEGLRILSHIAINEAISNQDFEKARSILSQYLTKYGIHIMPTIENMAVDGDWSYYSALAFDAKTNNACALLWKQGNRSTELEGIVFYNDANEVIFAQQEGTAIKGSCSINTAGVSLAKIVPMIKDVLKGKVKMDEKSLSKSLDQYSLNESVGEFEKEFVIESVDLAQLRKQRDNLVHRINYCKQKGKDYSDLEAQISAIKAQINANMVGGSVSTVYSKNTELQPVEDELEERSSPEERFADMTKYVKLVLSGVQPSLIVSGAPGVGKTYRITKEIEKQHTLGDDYYTIKGKCTPQKLFMTLFDYHEEGDILVIDDADDIITDDLSVNILKAATDSSDKRIVSYGTSKAPIADDNMVALHPEWEWDVKEFNGKTLTFYPASFEYKGSIIIITNMNAGQLDTALRNRSFVCDLAFNTEEVLSIVKSLIPAIMPGKIDSKAKMNAYDFLEELAASGKNMEISIRSFTTVAKIFSACGDNVAAAQRMVKEQMKLQFARGGKRY